MKIGFGSDHAGVLLKEDLIDYLSEKGYEVSNYGTDNSESVDYPDFANKVSKAVVKGDVDFGVLICGTGIGMSIAANKVRGVRAALVYDELTAKLAREHNHANVIALGARTNTFDSAKHIIMSFLNAKEEARHQKRLDKITKYENENEVK